MTNLTKKQILAKIEKDVTFEAAIRRNVEYIKLYATNNHYITTKSDVLEILKGRLNREYVEEALKLVPLRVFNLWVKGVNICLPIEQEVSFS